MRKYMISFYKLFLAISVWSLFFFLVGRLGSKIGLLAFGGLASVLFFFRLLYDGLRSLLKIPSKSCPLCKNSNLEILFRVPLGDVYFRCDKCEKIVKTGTDHCGHELLSDLDQAWIHHAHQYVKKGLSVRSYREELFDVLHALSPWLAFLLLGMIGYYFWGFYRAWALMVTGWAFALSYDTHRQKQWIQRNFHRNSNSQDLLDRFSLQHSVIPTEDR